MLPRLWSLRPQGAQWSNVTAWMRSGGSKCAWWVGLIVSVFQVHGDMPESGNLADGAKVLQPSGRKCHKRERERGRERERERERERGRWGVGRGEWHSDSCTKLETITHALEHHLLSQNGSPLCPSFGLVVASDMRLEPGGRKRVCVCACVYAWRHVWMCLCVCVHACVHVCVLFLAAELYQSCLGVRVVVNEPTQRTFFCPLTS